jgi:hypothetical protein
VRRGCRAEPNAGLYLPALLAWMLIYRREPAVLTKDAVIRRSCSPPWALVVPAIAWLWLWRLGLRTTPRSPSSTSTGFMSAGFFGRPLFSGPVEGDLAAHQDRAVCSLDAGAVVAVWDLARTQASPLAGLAVVWGAAAAL